MICSNKYFLILLSLFAGIQLFAAPPVPFSGKLAINGKNFHGHALFSFSIVGGEGTVHWKHADEPDATIENFVMNGRYLVLLGGQGMQTLPADLFLKHESLFLRVSVDLKDGQGMRLLEPDQRITSSPYALSAEIARLAKRAQVAGGVDAGAITADMLEQSLLADLNRTSELGEITREMLPQDVRDDLNRTVRLQDLSEEVSQSINRPITREMLPQEVRDELNATITRDRLSADVRADLNRTIGIANLSTEVTDKLNQTFSIDAGSITLDQLSQQVRDDINRTITRDRLSSDVLSDINRTITKSMLSQEVLIELNASIGPSNLSSEVSNALKPVVVGQPSSVVEHAGMPTYLAVDATGGDNTYQWKKNGVDIAGATSRTLAIADLNASQHEGNYMVVVSNAFGSVTSSVAQVDVNGSLTEGLVGWWKFDETSGNIAYDSSGNNRDGNFSAGGNWANGKLGGALDLNGSTSVQILNYKGVLGTTARSISMWLKSGSQNGGGLFSWGGFNSDGVQHRYGLTISTQGGEWDSDYGSIKLYITAGFLVGTQKVNTNEWFHVVVVSEENSNVVNSKLFLNLSEDTALKTMSRMINTASDIDVTFGDGLNGLLDDVRIYDRALSEVEVKALYELGEQPVQESGAGTTTVVNGTVADGSIGLAQLSTEVTDKLNQTFSIDAGSITLAQLSQQVRDDINRTITKSNLGSDVLSELNSSISLNRLSPEVLAALQVTPSISTQPFARYDWRTDSATIEARGRGHNISYKWLKNGEPIAGANAPVLELANPTLDDNATYALRITNSVGQTTSQTITLKQAIGAPGEPLAEANATQIPRNGLILWLDGADLNADGFMDNLLSGTNLVQWTDKVSGKHAIPTTSTNHPTIAEESVYFDGSDNIRIADLNLSAEQIFIVLKKQKLVGSFLKGEGGATHVKLDNFGISKSDWFNFVSGNGDVRISKGPNRTMYDQIFLASLLKNQTFGNDAYKWDVGNRLEIGLNSFKGHVYEVIIYDRILNQIERDSVEDFLIHKWQIETSRQYGENFPEPKPETDMVAYWKFDKVEIASTMIWDFSGNDRHLGTSGLANDNWISGVDGDALFFDGSNDKTGDSRSVGNFNFRSVCFWVKPTVPVDGRNDWNVALSVGWATSGLHEISFNKVISSGSGHFSIGRGTSYRETLETYNSLHEGWFHLAAVFDQADGTSGGYNLYLNGDPLPLTSMINSGLMSGSADFDFGRKGQPYFRGSLDEMKVYDRILSPAEIEALYNSYQNPIIRTSGEHNATVGSNFSLSLAADNGPTTYLAEGLPSGLSLNVTTGQITGTLSQPGYHRVFVKAMNEHGTGSDTIAIVARPQTDQYGWPVDVPDGSAIPQNGLVLWLDANDVDADGEFDSGTDHLKLANWVDKAGKDHNATQATAANQPEIRSGQLADNPNQLLSVFEGNQTLDFPEITQIRTYFCVAKYSSSGNGEWTGILGGATKWHGGSKFWSDRTSGILSNGDNRVNGSIYTSGSQPQGLKVFSGVSTEFASADIIGTGKAGYSTHFNGILGEILIFDRVLSTTEIETVEKYLGQKWGIAISHDNTPPTSGNPPTFAVTPANDSVTTAHLTEQILKYLKPEITAQPQANNVYADTNHTFSVTAEGKYLTYQWKKNGADLPGETNATLTITDANATQHDGNYSVVVSNDFGSVESGEFEVDVVTEVLDGLVGWWPLDGNASDLSGFGNHGTIGGSAIWVNGKIGGAFSFNGSQIISTNTNYGTQNTISAWCNFSSTASGQYQMLWSFSSPNLSFTSGDVSLNSFDGSANKFADFNTLQYAGQWLHFVTINTSAKTELYLNAQSIGTANYVSPSENSFVIGRSGYSLSGLVDEVRIYDRALSNAEVQALYNLGQ